jgi:hypothetical protein
MELSSIFNYFNETDSHVTALPPHVQESREREALLKDPMLVELLGNDVIREIKKVEGGYLVVTDLVEMKVDVHYLPSEPGFCGPAKFELFFNQPVSK